MALASSTLGTVFLGKLPYGFPIRAWKVNTFIDRDSFKNELVTLKEIVWCSLLISYIILNFAGFNIFLTSGTITSPNVNPNKIILMPYIHLRNMK